MPSPAEVSLKSGRPLFRGKIALRSAPRLAAKGGQFDAHSARSIFCHAHVAAENDFTLFAASGRQTLRGFFEKLCNSAPDHWSAIALKGCCFYIFWIFFWEILEYSGGSFGCGEETSAKSKKISKFFVTNPKFQKDLIF